MITLRILDKRTGFPMAVRRFPLWWRLSVINIWLERNGYLGEIIGVQPE